MRYLTTLPTLILASYAILANAHPTSRPHLLQERSNCTNALGNPSFDSTTLDPWKLFTSGSWAIHEPATVRENNFFGAISNTTNTSTFTLLQSFNFSTGEVECEARVKAVGDLGSVKVEAFVDEVKFGEMETRRREGWVKIAGKVSLKGDSHMVVLVATVNAEGVVGRGVGVMIDDVKVCNS